MDFIWFLFLGWRIFSYGFVAETVCESCRFAYINSFAYRQTEPKADREFLFPVLVFSWLFRDPYKWFCDVFFRLPGGRNAS